MTATGRRSVPYRLHNALVVAALALLLSLQRVEGRRPLSTAASDSTAAAAYASRLGSDAAGIHTWKNLVDHMNKYRSRHGAPPLTWSKPLAASAASWAKNCKFQHSSSGNGENLAWNYQNWRHVVDDWYKEEKMYNYHWPGWSPSIGHFTQVVWKGTKSVGCAYACHIYVCQYYPPGNVIGYFDKNVGRKKW